MIGLAICRSFGKLPEVRFLEQEARLPRMVEKKLQMK